MHYHMQNLNEDENGDPKGSAFVHGRAWWRLDDERAPTLGLEWNHQARANAAACLVFNRDEREITGHVAIPGASYFLTVGNVPRWFMALLPFGYRRARWSGGHRRIGARLFDRALWLSFWEDDHEWASSDPWWMRGQRIGLNDIARVLVGKEVHSQEQLSDVEVQIPMPEGSYAARAVRVAHRVVRERWPRWPFARRWDRTDIAIPDGIPIPGKGENDYDIGPDAIYSMSTRRLSLEDAIGEVVARTLRTRMQRAGTHVYTERSTPEAGPPPPPAQATVAP